jgi:protein MpaA
MKIQRGFKIGILAGALALGTTSISTATSTLRDEYDPQAIAHWCSELHSSIQKLKWNIDPCGKGIQWKVGGRSVQGRPLMYAEFGDMTAATNTTLILSAVHGDEVTPVYVGVQLVNWLREHQSHLGKKARVVVAPLVNPDGFYRLPRTRTNARGVDVNRNFGTRDWRSRAHLKNTRRYPGPIPRSEPETIFQEELIRRLKPQKILAVHSPLNFMDYDGPTALSLARFPQEYVRVCLKLRSELRAINGGYFPGSLGNYAGRELGIPTLTLELPSADPTKAQRYWDYFSKGIRTMIEFSVPNVSTSMTSR